jgi:hypothetical protein
MLIFFVNYSAILRTPNSQNYSHLIITIFFNYSVRVRHRFHSPVPVSFHSFILIDDHNKFIKSIFNKNVNAPANQMLLRVPIAKDNCAARPPPGFHHLGKCAADFRQNGCARVGVQGAVDPGVVVVAQHHPGVGLLPAADHANHILDGPARK